MKKLFGTDGMRGEAGVFPLDAKQLRLRDGLWHDNSRKNLIKLRALLPAEIPANRANGLKKPFMMGQLPAVHIANLPKLLLLQAWLF